MRVKSIINNVFSTKDKLFLLFELLFLFKFFYFDILWCLSTTFSSFSTIEIYLNSFLVVNILLLPYALFRCFKFEFVVAVLIDILMIVNLMYFRTYFTEIPLSSYGLAGNLADFTASVVDSIRWYDIIFPLSTFMAFEISKHRISSIIISKKWYLIRLVAMFMLSLVIIMLKGGFVSACDSLMSANKHTCRTPMYTLFGSLYYDSQQQEMHLTAERKTEIENWLNDRPVYKSLSDTLPQKTNCVLILMESFESWAIERSVEGKEVTPCLNKLLNESTTLYAPKVLTQVRGGRSIDAQLLIEAGMLPINSGAYSIRYPNDLYYTLPKAMKEIYNAHSYLCTVDKKITWNQNMVARAFGIDTILSKECYVNDEKVGSRKKLGDVSFFKQCVEKLKCGEIWSVGTNAYLQFVTYSGHNPFILPDKLKKIQISDAYPQRIRDYVSMANYTDSAIGLFIDYLKSRPDYKNTLVVITGDHEGLADDRASLASNKNCKGLVSPRRFTPFIVVNSPVGGRYEEVMGQIDIYPTILNLMHLDSYSWKGLGQSILDPNKKGMAIGSQMNLECDDKSNYSEVEEKRLRNAWSVSDIMICCDYFNQKSLNKK